MKLSSLFPPNLRSTARQQTRSRTFYGNETTLAPVGGSLGTEASWCWGTSCANANTLFSTSFAVAPKATTTYYVRARGLCDTTTCASATISVKVATPTISRGKCSFTKLTEYCPVAISTTTPDVTIYWTEGDPAPKPTTSSTVYSGTFDWPSNREIRAIAVRNGCLASDVAILPKK